MGTRTKELEQLPSTGVIDLSAKIVSIFADVQREQECKSEQMPQFSLILTLTHSETAVELHSEGAILRDDALLIQSSIQD